MTTQIHRDEAQDERDSTQVERREADHVWRAKMEEGLASGAKKFSVLETGQGNILNKLQENTDATINTNKKLDQHIDDTGNFRTDVLAEMRGFQEKMSGLDPVLSGVRVMGKIGDFGAKTGRGFAWIGLWVRRIVVFVLPIATLIGVVWGWMHWGK